MHLLKEEIKIKIGSERQEKRLPIYKSRAVLWLIDIAS